MQQAPNRMGLGMRPPGMPGMPGMPGPPMGGNMYGQMGPRPGGPLEKLTTVFVGSISAGVTNDFLTSLFSACGPLRSFTRNVAANGKLQGFGFVEFDEPDAVARALKLLHGKTIPAQEPDQPNKELVVRADDKVKAHLQAYEAARMRTDQDDMTDMTAETLIGSIIDQSNKTAAEAGNTASSALAAVPMHLRDLSEADLPENQRGLVISEIALFRERATQRRADPAPTSGGSIAPPPMPSRSAGVGGFVSATPNVPSGPKERVWGRGSNSNSNRGPESPTNGAPHSSPHQRQGSLGNGPQGYNQAPDFVRGEPAVAPRDPDKTDEELERDRKAERKREEDESFRDRERRWEAREHQRIRNLEQTIMRTRTAAAKQLRDGEEIRERLQIWDDDQSDEMFYTDRPRWRAARARFLKGEQHADDKSRALEARQAEHLRLESESFLAKQMEEMQSLVDEQRKAGLLLDDSAPVKLTIAPITAAATSTSDAPSKSAPTAGIKVNNKISAVFGAEDEEEDPTRKRKIPLVKIDFGGFEGDSRRERLEKIRAGIKTDKDALFKAKIRWDGINDHLIDHKLERLVRSLMIKYLGELDDDDMVMFVLEHLKDHKPPSKIVEGLEPVLLEEAAEFTISLWRQIVFESTAYGEGFETDDMLAN